MIPETEVLLTGSALAVLVFLQLKVLDHLHRQHKQNVEHALNRDKAEAARVELLLGVIERLTDKQLETFQSTIVGLAREMDARLDRLEDGGGRAATPSASGPTWLEAKA